jgi:hypothetical protein
MTCVTDALLTLRVADAWLADTAFGLLTLLSLYLYDVRDRCLLTLRVADAWLADTAFSISLSVLRILILCMCPQVCSADVC